MFRSKEVNKLKKELNYFKSKYLRKQGCASMNGIMITYELISTNGGNDWYAIDKNGRIIGEAEIAHPGLMAHLENINKLCSGNIEAGLVINF